MPTRSMILIAALTALTWACGDSVMDTRLSTRAVIEGRVVLASGAGLADMSRVAIDLGQGEGGVAVAADGGFRFADLEPDLYSLTVTYTGGLTAEADVSAYRRYHASVTAAAGSVTNLGDLHLELGSGSVSGSLTVTPPVAIEAVTVTLTGPSSLVAAPDETGAYRFDHVPVGRYHLTAAAAGAVEHFCVSDQVLVGYDGHSLAITPTAVQGTVVTFTPQARVVGGVWYIDGGTLQVQVDAPFATLARLWTGESAPPYQAFSSGGTLGLTGLEDGRHQVRLQFKNGCGQESEIYEHSVVKDTQAPQGWVLTVASGATYSATPVVLVLIAAQAGAAQDVAQMQVACDGTPDSEPWLAFSNAYLCVLAPGDGTREVVVLLADVAGNVSAPLRDDIFIDSHPPTMPVLANPSERVNAATWDLSLAVAAVDPQPSAGLVYQCRDASSDWQDCDLGASLRRTFTLLRNRENRLGVRARDQAGNLSGEDFVFITEDSSAPEPPRSIRVFEGNQKAIVRWDPSPSPDVAGYRLYYGPSENGPFYGAFAPEGVSAIDAGLSTSLGLTSLPNNAEFFVTVTAYDHTQTPQPNESSMPLPGRIVLPNRLTPEAVGDVTLGSEPNLWPRDVFVQGDLAYVVSSASDTRSYLILDIVDLSNPAAPVVVGTRQDAFASLSNSSRGIWVSGEYAFQADGTSGLLFLDVSDPTAPRRLKTCALGGSDALDVAVAGRYAYVTTNENNFKIVDIANPRTVGCTVYSVTLSGPSCSPPNYNCSRNIAVRRNTAYVGAFAGGLQLYNVSNPASVTYLGGYDPVNTTASDLQVSGGVAYYISRDPLGYEGVRAVDVSNPAAPSELGFYSGPLGNRLLVAGSLVYVITSGDHTLQAIDFSDPTRPALAGAVGRVLDSETISQNCKIVRTAMALSGNLLTIVHRGDSGCSTPVAPGLQIYELATPYFPALIGGFDTDYRATHVAASGTVAYLAENISSSAATLYLLDVRVPGDIRVLDSYTFAHEISGLALQEPFLYVAQGTAGFSVFHAEVLSAPIRSYGAGLTSIGDLAVRGRYAYLTDNRGTDSVLWIYDVVNPGGASPVGMVPIADSSLASQVTVHGSYAYVVEYHTGLHVVEVADPLAPRHRGSLLIPSLESLGVHGRYAFVAGTTSQSFSIVDVGDPDAPVLLRQLTPAEYGGAAKAVITTGDKAFLAGGSFSVLDISSLLADPPAPAEVLFVGAVQVRGLDLAVLGDVAFLAGDAQGLRVLALEP